MLDKSTIHVYGRWVFTAVLLCVYLLRVFSLNAFHIVTYGLGIYLLNLFIGFLSPQVGPSPVSRPALTCGFVTFCVACGGVPLD